MVLPVEHRISAVAVRQFDKCSSLVRVDNFHDIYNGGFESCGGRARGIEKRILEVHLAVQ
jgi:hypothetical protein